jgi:hypothetical protein
MRTNGSIMSEQNPATPGEGALPAPRFTSPKHFIIALRCGRLGNRLVLFANFMALAEELGHRVTNVTFHSYAEFFETTSRDIYCRYPATGTKSRFDTIPLLARGIRQTRIFPHAVRAASWLHERTTLFGKSVVVLREQEGRKVTLLTAAEVEAQIRSARTVFVYGWSFRAPEYVRRHAEKIRAYFRPLGTVVRAGHETVARLRQNADLVVGVHVRHGDFRTWHGGRHFFDPARYAAWMRELAEQFPGRKTAFLVCSDERRHPGEFPGLAVGFGPGSLVGDLYALAECEYVMGPPSTFSQWASFYGNKPLLFLSNNLRIEREKFQVSYLEEIP